MERREGRFCSPHEARVRRDQFQSLYGRRFDGILNLRRPGQLAKLKYGLLEGLFRSPWSGEGRVDRIAVTGRSDGSRMNADVFGNIEPLSRFTDAEERG
jgi:hypothetical protein